MNDDGLQYVGHWRSKVRERMGWNPDTIFDLVEDITLVNRESVDFEVLSEPLRYLCRLKARSGSDCLHVSLRSSIGEPQERSAFFVRDDWGAPLRGHVLAIYDPTLLMNEKMRVGCFLGRHDADPIPGIVAIAEKVADLLGVPSTRIVFWGSSSGAFGAAMAAVASKNGKAVLVNPLLEVPEFKRTHAGPAILETFGDGTYEEVFAKYPLRLSVSTALADAATRGNLPRLLVAQNKMDLGFYSFQFLPFARFVDQHRSKANGRWKEIQTLEYSDPDGHGMEPVWLARKIVQSNFLLRLSNDQACAPDHILYTQYKVRPGHRYSFGLDESAPWIAHESGLGPDGAFGRWTAGKLTRLGFYVAGDARHHDLDINCLALIGETRHPAELTISLPDGAVAWKGVSTGGIGDCFRFKVNAAHSPTQYEIEIEIGMGDAAALPSFDESGNHEPRLWLADIKLTERAGA